MPTLIGTSGYSYKDWVGPFYPPDLPQKERLRFYAQEFATCELNFTYYRLPTAQMMERMAERVPDGFLFALKAYRGITHERGDNAPEQAEKFRAALTPLVAAGKFAGLLLQFPYSFHATPANRDYLKRVREWFGRTPLVVEFRSRDWITARTFDDLRSLEMGYCCVDLPPLRNLVPPLAVVTAPLAYVRFHGRNRAKWWRHQESWERYDYAYSDDELREWVPKIRRLESEAALTLVYANNHRRGQAVSTARQLRTLLGESL